ncbi:ionotropic receptor 21a-like [Haemaphysalis longicornis]
MIFKRVGCRAVVVTDAASYVPLDTYVNCTRGVRPLTGPDGDAFDDRPVANLTTLRKIEEFNLRRRKDWRKTRLEPQTTIVESILQESGAATADDAGFEKFGKSNEHSLFSGAVGAVQMKQRDLASFEIYLMEKIWFAVDIAGQPRYDSLMFLSPLPKPITDLAIIGKPFTFSLWMAVWTSLGVYLVLLLMITRTRLGAGQPPEASEEALKFCFYLFSALINHAPAMRIPKRSSARILVGVWFLFTIVMSAGFTAMLTSYTNFPPKTQPIKTMRQLSRALKNGDVKLCIVSHGCLCEVVSYHLGHRSKVLWEHVAETLHCPDTLCCLAKVAAGTHVFVTNREEARMNAGKSLRGTVRSEEDFVLVHVVMIAPRNSPYTKAFAAVSRRMMETGVSTFSQKLRKFRNIRSRAMWKAKVQRRKQSSPYRVLHLKDLYGMFVVWGFGLTLALSVLFCEVAWEAMWWPRVRNSEALVRSGKVVESDSRSLGGQHE